MSEKPLLISKLPTKTKFLYFLIGIAGGAFGCVYNFLDSYPTFFESLNGVLDLITSFAFLCLFFYSILQLSYKTILYSDRLVIKTMLTQKEAKLKEMAGYFSMDESDLKRKRAFRGILIKNKNGSSIALHKGKLSQYDEIVQLLKSKIHRYNQKPVAKLMRKENRKIYLRVSVLILLLTLSMLH